MPKTTQARQSTTRTHYRTCNICEAMCGLEITYREREVLSIRGDREDPFSRGHICPKAVALQDFYKDPDRLRRPLRRTSSGWEEVSWDAALDEVASRLGVVRERHGKNAVGVYLGNPNAHNLGNALFLRTFFRSLGTLNRYSSASADQLPHHVASNTMLGHGMLIPVPDIDRTDFLLIIGGNPLVSNGSMMTAPGFPKRMRAIQERGGRVVVIDPRRTETARKADRHFFIRPETDALLLLGLISTLFAEELVNLRHLESLCDGLDELEAVARTYTPERVAGAVGIEAAAIRGLARDMATAPSAVCYSRMGASTQSFGGLCQWLTNLFNILSGNFDREGGAMFTLPAFDYVSITSRKGRRKERERPTSRVRGLPFYNGEFPVAALAEEIATEGDGQIKALVAIAGNPVLSSPNGRRLEKAFAKLDFMVAIDIYLNETSRHADLILPPATGLESSHYDIFFHVFAVRNSAKYSPPLFPRTEHQRYDWEILKGLSERLSGNSDGSWTPEGALDMALRGGPYGKEGMSLDHLKAHPHGVDLGPLRPLLPKRLQTEDGRIQLAPSIYLEDLGRLDKVSFSVEKTDAHFPLRLIGRRLPRSHNTWTHNAERLMRGPQQCTLRVHPRDAGALGIEDQQQILVRSATGQVEIEAEISDEMMPGVVSMPQGWGRRKDTGMSVAATRPGVSINDLTDEKRVDTLTGNAAFSGVPVKIERVAGTR